MIHLWGKEIKERENGAMNQSDGKTLNRLEKAKGGGRWERDRGREERCGDNDGLVHRIAQGRTHLRLFYIITEWTKHSRGVKLAR